jgi:DNA modification methylase
MLEQGWILNDELLWIKNNPTYTRGKRSVRSHEPIFHFVKSSDFYYNDAWIKDLTDKEDKISYGINKSSPKVKSGLDFREGVLTTNVSNTSDLRTKCKEEEGFYLTHSATFPIDVPAICGFLTTQEGGTILDPFSGTSTVGLFARSNNRKYIGYDLNPEFIKASEVRIGGHLLYLPTNTLISWIQLHSLKEKSETGIISEFQVLKSYLRPVPSKGRISFSDFTKTYNRCFQIAQKISYE